MLFQFPDSVCRGDSEFKPACTFFVFHIIMMSLSWYNFDKGDPAINGFQKVKPEVNYCKDNLYK